MSKPVRVLQAEDEAITAMQMDGELQSLMYEVVPHLAAGEAAGGERDGRHRGRD